MNQFEMRQKAYQSTLTARALQVLLYLIDRADKAQTCFPAVPTIGRELHISISTVKRAMKELISSGYVSRESRFREKNGGQTSNLYTLSFPEQTESEEEERQGQAEMCVGNYETTLTGVEESCAVNAESAADCDGAASDEESVTSENNKADSIGTYGYKRHNRLLGCIWTGVGVIMIPP